MNLMIIIIRIREISQDCQVSFFKKTKNFFSDSFRDIHFLGERCF